MFWWNESVSWWINTSFRIHLNWTFRGVSLRWDLNKYLLIPRDSRKIIIIVRAESSYLVIARSWLEKSSNIISECSPQVMRENWQLRWSCITWNNFSCHSTDLLGRLVSCHKTKHHCLAGSSVSCHFVWHRLITCRVRKFTRGSHGFFFFSKMQYRKLII